MKNGLHLKQNGISAETERREANQDSCAWEKVICRFF